MVFADSFQQKLGQWFAQGETVQLEQAIAERLRKNPSETQLWLELADSRKSLGDYDGAVTAYQSYLTRNDPLKNDPWMAQAAMGLALEHGGKFQEAETILEKLYPQHPKEGEILWGLAQIKIHESEGKGSSTPVSTRKALKEAKKLLLGLTVLKPDFPLGFWELAEVLNALKDVDGALLAYQEVVKLDGSYKQAYRHIAHLLAVKKQYRQALAKYEQALSIDPDNAGLKEEAQKVSQEAPLETAQRKQKRDREWEKWTAPAEITVAASSVTLRVGISKPLQKLLLRGESDLLVTTPAQTPITVLSANQDYQAVYLPAKDSPRHKDVWLLETLKGKLLARFDQRVWIVPQDSKKAVILHAIPSNVGYFFAKEEDRAYRGLVELSPRPGVGFQVINRVSLEDYTAGVLPSEMSFSWPVEALKAQAIVARTYVLSKMGRHNDQGFDVCDTVHCEAYRGLVAETEKTNKAVNVTAGQVLKAGKNILAVVYSAQCGGHTQDYKEAWGYDVPVVGVKDYDDGENKDMDFPLSPLQLETWVKENRQAYCFRPELRGYRNYRWAMIVPAADLMKKAKGIGRVRQLIVTRRSPAGWAEHLLVRGEKGDKEIKGDPIRSFLGGLRSSLFWIEAQVDEKGWPEEFFIYGGGWGHGVGMCQVGTYSLAKAGKNCGEILRHYFPKAEIKKL